MQYTTGTVDTDMSRDVLQYHFTSWPDHGVPESAGPILNYLRRIKDRHKSDKGPILTHCRCMYTHVLQYTDLYGTLATMQHTMYF